MFGELRILLLGLKDFLLFADLGTASSAERVYNYTVYVNRWNVEM